MAASDMFCIEVKGKGGHGAAPQGTVDAIVEAAHLVTGVLYLFIIKLLMILSISFG